MLGRHHPLLRRLRALRRQPARRRAEGLFLAEGPRLARVALAAGAAIELAVVSPRLAASETGRALADELRRRVPVEETSDALLDGLQDASSAQPALLVCRRPSPGLEALGRAAAPWIVACCGLQDPGNLGSVLRTADAAGASGLAICGGADPFHPRAVRASAGSIFRLPAVETSGEALLAWLRQREIPAVGTDARGEVAHRRAGLRPPLAIFLGGEGAGLPAPVRQALARTVRIPIREGVESLSVGAAAAVVLFEIAGALEDAATRSDRNGG